MKGLKFFLNALFLFVLLTAFSNLAFGAGIDCDDDCGDRIEGKRCIIIKDNAHQVCYGWVPKPDEGEETIHP